MGSCGGSVGRGSAPALAQQFHLPYNIPLLLVIGCTKRSDALVGLERLYQKTQRRPFGHRHDIGGGADFLDGEQSRPGGGLRLLPPAAGLLRAAGRKGGGHFLRRRLGEC